MVGVPVRHCRSVALSSKFDKFLVSAVQSRWTRRVFSQNVMGIWLYGNVALLRIFHKWSTYVSWTHRSEIAQFAPARVSYREGRHDYLEV